MRAFIAKMDGGDIDVKRSAYFPMKCPEIAQKTRTNLEAKPSPDE